MRAHSYPMLKQCMLAIESSREKHAAAVTPIAQASKARQVGSYAGFSSRKVNLPGQIYDSARLIYHTGVSKKAEIMHLFGAVQAERLVNWNLCANSKVALVPSYSDM